MKLKLIHLYRLDQKPSSSSGVLKNCFSDRFLIERNKTYCNIRQSARLRGFQFTDRDEFNYSVSPLLALPEILRTKKIPYIANAKAINHALKRNSQLDVSYLQFFKPNYLLHESAHLICADLTKSRDMKIQTSKDFFLLALQESYASTCEVLAVSEAIDTIHTSMISFSCYSLLNEDEFDNVRSLQSQIGREKVFRTLLAAYLCSNYLLLSVSDSDFKALMRALKVLSPKDDFDHKLSRLLRKVFDQSLNLSIEFRVVTASQFLKYLGASRSLYSLTRAKPISFLRHGDVQTTLSKLYQMTQRHDGLEQL